MCSQKQDVITTRTNSKGDDVVSGVQRSLSGVLPNIKNSTSTDQKQKAFLP